MKYIVQTNTPSGIHPSINQSPFKKRQDAQPLSCLHIYSHTLTKKQSSLPPSSGTNSPMSTPPLFSHQGPIDSYANIFPPCCPTPDQELAAISLPHPIHARTGVDQPGTNHPMPTPVPLPLGANRPTYQHIYLPHVTVTPNQNLSLPPPSHTHKC